MTRCPSIRSVNPRPLTSRRPYTSASTSIAPRNEQESGAPRRSLGSPTESSPTGTAGAARTTNDAPRSVRRSVKALAIGLLFSLRILDRLRVLEIEVPDPTVKVRGLVFADWHPTAEAYREVAQWAGA